MAGIYLHIPFCKTRCIYCDFYSTTDESKWKARYIDALCRELELRKTYLQEEEIETIYFGGGTPSQLLPEDFVRIFETIRTVYGMEHCKEITLEANPDDLTAAYIRELSRLPFNRLSIGIQTFNDDLLKLLRRRHSAGQAIAAVEECRRQGFENISIDLMYGLPGETLERWENDLEKALKLDVEHISAYHLIYEEGTPLWEMRKKHRVEETDEDISVDFFARMIERLTQNDFAHYEISNFCRPDKYALHNSSYWNGKKYLGCGPSAHSYDGVSRQWNVASLPIYIIGMENGTPKTEKEELSLYTRYNDFVITSLRTMWGLSLIRLRDEFGCELYDYCLENARKHLMAGRLILKDQTLSLSPAGLFTSDGIMSDLLWVE